MTKKSRKKRFGLFKTDYFKEKREILSLLNTKIQNLEEDLETAKDVESNARDALNTALAS